MNDVVVGALNDVVVGALNDVVVGLLNDVADGLLNDVVEETWHEEIGFDMTLTERRRRAIFEAHTTIARLLYLNNL